MSIMRAYFFPKILELDKTKLLHTFVSITDSRNDFETI